jgi:hypothetical protein
MDLTSYYDLVAGSSEEATEANVEETEDVPEPAPRTCTFGCADG